MTAATEPPLAAASRTWRAAGDVWFSDDGRELLALVGGPAPISVRGAPRDALMAARYDAPVLRALARLEPRVATVIARLSQEPHAPLTRGHVLKGSGYGLLFIELTDRCNERCVHCYADAAPERSTFLPRSLAFAALEDAARLGFDRVELTGGDPLLHPELVSIVRHARSCGIPMVEIYTNGLALTASLLDALEPLGARFAFSYYSHRAEDHDAITQVPGSHTRTTRAIRAVMERGLGLRIGVTLQHSTHHQRADIVAALRESGVPREAIGIAVERSVGRGTHLDLDLDLDVALVSEHTHGGEQPEEDVLHARGRACVAADGRVYLCVFERTRPLGDLRETSLAAVLDASAPVHLPPSLVEGMHASSARLSCGACQLRQAALWGGKSAPDLVQLGRGRP